LKALESQPLLRDEELLRLDELQLDVHARWLGSDTQHYTPWTRHDELRKPMVESLVKAWAHEVVAVSVRAISKDLSQEHDVRRIAMIRHDVLQMWLSSRQDFNGLNTRQPLNELRTIFNQAIETVMSKAFADFQDSLCRDTSDTFNEWTVHSRIGPGSLWSSDLLTIDLDDGATKFKRAINRRRRGLHAALDPILDKFSTKTNNIADIRVVIADMRKTRWDDDGYADDEDASVDVDIDEIPNQLSKEDPSTLEATMRRDADLCISQIETTFTKQIIGDLADCSSPTAPGLFVIRLVREMRQRLPALASHLSAHRFADPLLQKLHSALACAVSANSRLRLTSAMDTVTGARGNVSALWEGMPPLPVQPSPGVYMYLHTVVKEMGRLGPDLWVPMVVARVKRVLCQVVAEEVARTTGVLIKLEKRFADDSAKDGERRSDEHVQQYETSGKGVEAVETVHVAGGDAEAPAQEEITHDDSTNLNGATVSETVHTTNPKDDASDVGQPIPGPTPSKASVERADGDKIAESSSSPILPTENAAHVSDTTDPTAPAETEMPSAQTQPPSETLAANSANTPPPSFQATYDTQAQLKLTQLLFDTLYLQHALSPFTSLAPAPLSDDEADVAQEDGQTLLTTTADTLIDRCVEAVRHADRDSLGESEGETGKPEVLDVLRLRRSAEACWRRGYLLFGLLWAGNGGTVSIQSAAA